MDPEAQSPRAQESEAIARYVRGYELLPETEEDEAWAEYGGRWLVEVPWA